MPNNYTQILSLSIYIYILMHMCIYVYACIYIYMYIYICMNACMCIYNHIYIYIRVCVFCISITKTQQTWLQTNQTVDWEPHHVPLRSGAGLKDAIQTVSLSLSLLPSSQVQTGPVTRICICIYIYIYIH